VNADEALMMARRASKGLEAASTDDIFMSYAADLMLAFDALDKNAKEGRLPEEWMDDEKPLHCPTCDGDHL
jgi:hypothetical protein